MDTPKCHSTPISFHCCCHEFFFHARAELTISDQSVVEIVAASQFLIEKSLLLRMNTNRCALKLSGPSNFVDGNTESTTVDDQIVVKPSISNNKRHFCFCFPWADKAATSIDYTNKPPLETITSPTVNWVRTGILLERYNLYLSWWTTMSMNY